MNNLWSKLQQQNLVTGELPEDTQILIPWYIRVMQGFAGWVAAWFLIAFLATVFTFLFKYNNDGILIAAGIICTVIAYSIIRLQKSDFFEQLGMAFSLAGQLMVAVGLLWFLKIDKHDAFYILAAYQLVLAWIIPQYVHRLLTTSFGLIVLLIAFNLSGLHGVGSTLLAVLFSFIWLRETSWGKRYDFWEPIGFGIAITMVVSGGFLLSRNFWIREFFYTKQTWWYFNAELINSLLIALIFVNFVVVMLKENKIAYSTKTAILSFIAATILVAISFKIYGISLGLLILLVGFARQRKSLIALGAFATVSFFSWYYYNLNATLLYKSIVLIILGTVMLVTWLAVNYIYGNRASNNFSNLRPKTIGKNKWLVISTIILALAAINININKKEALIASGDILLFRLAPVDPRSLMQGDYMRLRFDIANETRNALTKLNGNNTIAINSGEIVVSKGEHDVVKFAGLYNDEQLQANQYKIPFKYRKHQIVFTTNAFYFQEGKAKHFQKARFGLFRVSNNGEILLVNMVDKDFSIL